ncbi:uncharacterized protein LOC120270368 [Dioscorea cayenensis subsp. rotundata]|uniref:Uncharacterized protein LOC120270368 n=1 Tax=Dioscorea cayennensis subsp. rotundata TaxID=55577 RepID=A0AB40C0N4_DIOCR|nr:uncharacterized protein LOC120270368 [Dioscorea cayenensis subsp. rotundata]
MKEVVKTKVMKLLDARIIYPISDNVWVSPVQVAPKKEEITAVTNEKNELIPTRTVTGWRVCIDYRKLNDATRKGHLILPFIDQMLERLVGIPTIASWTNSQGTFRSPLPQKIRKILHSHARMTPLHTIEYPSDCATHLPPSRGAY